MIFIYMIWYAMICNVFPFGVMCDFFVYGWPIFFSLSWSFTPLLFLSVFILIFGWLFHIFAFYTLILQAVTFCFVIFFFLFLSWFFLFLNFLFCLKNWAKGGINFGWIYSNGYKNDEYMSDCLNLLCRCISVTLINNTTIINVNNFLTYIVFAFKPGKKVHIIQQKHIDMRTDAVEAHIYGSIMKAQWQRTH